jgi:hypothetical protein
VLRISVPDLEYNARIYLASAKENRGDPVRHRWHTIQLLDQMTRTAPGGQKLEFLKMAQGRPEVQQWVRPLLNYELLQLLDRRDPPPTLAQRLKKLIKELLGGQSYDKLGDRHFWTFDAISLPEMLRSRGFSRVEIAAWNRSLSAAFLSDNLDAQDGAEYKPGSLYVEGIK